jgi:hypothetical protein
MAFSPETKEKFRQIEEEQDREWEAMTEAEREKIRQISRRFVRKVASCYPPEADYSYSSKPIS